MTSKRLSVRQFFGYGLIVVCALAWAAVVAVPFLDVDLGRGAAIVAGLIIVGEGAFIVGIALLGKEILTSAKALIDRLKQELRR